MSKILTCLNCDELVALLPLAPNEGRNNWCHSRLRDFDFETFRDFFILRDEKTSGAMAPVAPPSSAALVITYAYARSMPILEPKKMTTNDPVRTTSIPSIFAGQSRQNS